MGSIAPTSEISFIAAGDFARDPLGMIAHRFHLLLTGLMIAEA
jgi:hypothetical protein